MSLNKDLNVFWWQAHASGSVNSFENCVEQLKHIVNVDFGLVEQLWFQSVNLALKVEYKSEHLG